MKCLCFSKTTTPPWNKTRKGRTFALDLLIGSIDQAIRLRKHDPTKLLQHAIPILSDRIDKACEAFGVPIGGE